MPVKRTIKNTSTADQGGIAAIETNMYAGAKKVLEVGPEFQKIAANTFVSGIDASTVQPVIAGSIAYLYNNAGTVAWVGLRKGAAPATPTGFTNAIPLQPNSWTRLCIGDNDQILTSAATVGLYIAKDDTVYIPVAVE